VRHLFFVVFLFLTYPAIAQEAPYFQWQPALSSDSLTAWTVLPDAADEHMQLDWLLKTRDLQLDTRLYGPVLPRAKVPDLYFYLLFLAFLTLALLVRRNPQYFKNMWAAVFNFRLMLQFVREQGSQMTAFSILYVLVFNLLLALFLAEVVFQTTRVSWISSPQWAVFLAFGVVSSVYLIKYIFYKFLGVILGMKEQANFYLAEVFLLNRVVILFFLPLLALMLYGNQLFSQFGTYAVLLLLIATLVWRYTNAARMISRLLFAQSLHFILYFCAVEIIPTAVIAKFLLNV
jgi:hypothetical protein